MSAEESTRLAVAEGIACQSEAWHMYVDNFEEVVNSYLRRITEWWSTWWPWHKERDDRIEVLTAEVAEFREEVAALRGTQDVLAMFKEKRLFKLKFKHSLLQELREERASIDATILQEVLHKLGQERLQEQKRGKQYDSEKTKVLQDLRHELRQITFHPPALRARR